MKPLFEAEAMPDARFPVTTRGAFKLKDKLEALRIKGKHSVIFDMNEEFNPERISGPLCEALTSFGCHLTCVHVAAPLLNMPPLESIAEVIAALPNVTSVNLAAEKISEEFLLALSKSKSLKRLYLSKSFLESKRRGNTPAEGGSAATEGSKGKEKAAENLGSFKELVRGGRLQALRLFEISGDDVTPLFRLFEHVVSLNIKRVFLNDQGLLDALFAAVRSPTSRLEFVVLEKIFKNKREKNDNKAANSFEKRLLQACQKSKSLLYLSFDGKVVFERPVEPVGIPEDIQLEATIAKRKVSMVVWANVAGYPLWPAKIAQVTPEETMVKLFGIESSVPFESFLVLRWCPRLQEFAKAAVVSKNPAFNRLFLKAVEEANAARENPACGEDVIVPIDSSNALASQARSRKRPRTHPSEPDSERDSEPDRAADGGVLTWPESGHVSPPSGPSGGVIMPNDFETPPAWKRRSATSSAKGLPDSDSDPPDLRHALDGFETVPLASDWPKRKATGATSITTAKRRPKAPRDPSRVPNDFEAAPRGKQPSTNRTTCDTTSQPGAEPDSDVIANDGPQREVTDGNSVAPCKGRPNSGSDSDRRAASRGEGVRVGSASPPKLKATGVTSPLANGVSPPHSAPTPSTTPATATGPRPMHGHKRRASTNQEKGHIPTGGPAPNPGPSLEQPAPVPRLPARDAAVSSASPVGPSHEAPKDLVSLVPSHSDQDPFFFVAESLDPVAPPVGVASRSPARPLINGVVSLGAAVAPIAARPLPKSHVVSSTKPSNKKGFAFDQSGQGQLGPPKNVEGEIGGLVSKPAAPKFATEGGSQAMSPSPSGGAVARGHSDHATHGSRDTESEDRKRAERQSRDPSPSAAGPSVMISLDESRPEADTRPLSEETAESEALDTLASVAVAGMAESETESKSNPATQRRARDADGSRDDSVAVSRDPSSSSSMGPASSQPGVDGPVTSRQHRFQVRLLGCESRAYGTVLRPTLEENLRDASAHFGEEIMEFWDVRYDPVREASDLISRGLVMLLAVPKSCWTNR